MSHSIINTPSVYSCKLPYSGWINLAQIRQLQYEACETSPYDLVHTVPLIVITWSNGDKQTFRKEDAVILYEAWIHASKQIIDNRACNYRQLNRRN